MSIVQITQASSLATEPLGRFKLNHFTSGSIIDSDYTRNSNSGISYLE